MRYLRIYAVINFLMAGALHAAEASSFAPTGATADKPAEGVPAGVDEEPPQHMSEASFETSSSLLRSPSYEGQAAKATADVEPVKEANQPSPEMPAAATAPLTEPQPQAVAIPESPKDQNQVPEPEPTVEEAEALINEADQEATQASSYTDASADRANPAMPGASMQAGVPRYKMPEPPQDAAITAAIIEEEPKGIDTVDLEQPQGNWLFKRYWWERAEETYKKLRANGEKVSELRMKLFSRRTELDKTILDPFYADIGLTQSDLQRSMQGIMSQLEQEREEHGTLSDEERELMEAIKKDRERLQQLNRDINAVGTLRDEADRAIDQMMEQKKRVSQYETEAWESMREIGRIVNDTKASALFYRMDAGARTVKDILKYIEQDLNRYFDKLIANAREQTERIKTALQALKEQGVDLKARVQEAQEHEVGREAAVAAEEEKEKEKNAAPKKTGWFASGSRLFQAAIDVALWQFLQSIWDVIMWLPRRIYSTFTSIFR